MNRFFRVGTITLIAIFSLVGCEKEDPNPELRDPIWQDISKRAADYEKQRDENKAKLATLREKLEKVEPNSMDLKDVKRDIAKTEKALLGSEQLYRYYKIRADRRKVVDKISAREAFAAKKEWPDKSEYSDYLTNIRLHEINLNWNARVPKLQDRLSRKPAKAEKGSGEGEAAAEAPKGH